MRRGRGTYKKEKKHYEEGKGGRVKIKGAFIRDENSTYQEGNGLLSSKTSISQN